MNGTAAAAAVVSNTPIGLDLHGKRSSKANGTLKQYLCVVPMVPGDAKASPSLLLRRGCRSLQPRVPRQRYTAFVRRLEVSIPVFRPLLPKTIDQRALVRAAGWEEEIIASDFVFLGLGLKFCILFNV